MDCHFLAASVLIIAATSLSCAQNVEQRYATRWNVDPIIRFSIDKNLEVNATKCRIDVAPYKDIVLKGRPVGIIHGRPTWQIFAPDIAPGVYKATHDLRTPVGAEFIEGTLRVPQIARHTGNLKPMSPQEAWPQDKHPRIAQDKGSVEFAWDRENLYIRPASIEKNVVKIAIDLLPNVPGKHIHEVSVRGRTALPWSTLSPAGPYVGQVLRCYVIGDDGKRSDERDILFVGSGTGIYFGATMVGESINDDQGPPLEIMRALVDMSGLDLRSAGIDWADVEKSDPGNGESKYDWTKFRTNPDPYSGKSIHVNINLDCLWANEVKKNEPERYKKIAQRFLDAAVKQCVFLGIKTFSLGYNEPEMFFRSDRERFFAKDLDFLAAGVRGIVPDADIIAGKFSSGDEGLIKRFYYNGFKDNFTILDIHPYNNDPRTGTAMGEVVTSHETLEELGMGQKRIYLGEGWGPTRNLHQVNRNKYDEPVSPKEADFHRQFYQNGYRELITPRMDYSPDWVLGAKYFTLNDNVGGTYWKQSAKPVKNAKGEVEYYLIGELRFDNPEEFKASFWNGGLIDFQGRPKGQWFYDFPPSLPQVRMLASGDPKYVLVGEEHELKATVTNADNRPITNLKIGLRSQTGKWKGELAAEAVGSV